LNYIIHYANAKHISGLFLTIIDYFLFCLNNNIDIKLISLLDLDFFLNIIYIRYKDEYTNFNFSKYFIKIKENPFELSKLIKNQDTIITYFRFYLFFKNYINKYSKKLILHEYCSIEIFRNNDFSNYKFSNNEQHFSNVEEQIGIPFKYNNYVKKIWLEAIKFNNSNNNIYDYYINLNSDRVPNEKDFNKYFYNIIKNKKVFITNDNEENITYFNKYQNCNIFNTFINIFDYNFTTYIYFNNNAKRKISDNSCRSLIEMKYFKKNIIYLNPFNFKDGAYYRYLDDDIDKYKLNMNDEIINLL
jgi:hypothetical protein